MKADGLRRDHTGSGGAHRAPCHGIKARKLLKRKGAQTAGRKTRRDLGHTPP